MAALAVLLAASDTYVVVVALPNIMTSVGIGVDHLQRAAPIISGFLLGYTAVLPLIGRITDEAGTATSLRICLLAFAVGSLITATSHTLSVVVLGRSLQGVGGGGMIPVALAMVAARWPPDQRGIPLGIIGAVQELGSLIGPLYGAAVVAVSSWRTIFWVNLPITAILGAVLWFTDRGISSGRHDDLVAQGSEKGRRYHRNLVGAALGLLGAVGLIAGLEAPASLADSVTFGSAYAPLAGGPWASLSAPVVVASAALLAASGAWTAFARGKIRRSSGAVIPWGRLRRADLAGALLLAGVLSCIVIAFSTANPAKQVLASSTPVVAPIGVLLAALFWWRQRHAEHALIPRGSFAARPAWGSLLVNLWLGAALIAALVDIPLFARSTVDPNSEIAASFVLVRFLVAVPIGAVVGGVLCRNRRRAPYIAACGMVLSGAAFVVMSTWSATALGGAIRPSDLELLVCGLGFGLAASPLNVAILGAVEDRFHALAGALGVVSRTVGMLAGLSALTAVALHRFYLVEARIPSAFTLCPSHPTSCPAFNAASTNAVVGELHTIFVGAALSAGAAAALALWTLGSATAARTPTM